MVEYMKQMLTAQARRYKLGILAAFIAGFIASLFTLAFVIFMPTTTPLFTFSSTQHLSCSSHRTVTSSPLS